MPRTASQSDEPKANSRLRLGIGLLGAVILILGPKTFLDYQLRPLLRSRAASGWTAVPCTIESSGVHRTRSDKSAFKVGVKYKYAVAGRAFEGDRYKFADPSRNYGDAESIVVGLREGSVTRCYVNPALPSEAVINREFDADEWETFIVTLVLLLASPFAVYWAAFDGSRSPVFLRRLRTFAPLDSSTTFSLPSSERAPTILRHAKNHWKSIGGSILWGTMFVAFAVVFLIRRSPASGGEWALAGLMSSPVIVMGAFFLTDATRELLTLSNPHVSVSVRSPLVALGDSLEVHWSIAGDAERLRGFRLDFEGREEIRYEPRRGKYRVATMTRTFATLPVTDEKKPVKPEGSALVNIPERSMHTFLAPHNKVIWSIRVREDVANRPDTDETFPVTVTPRHR